MSQKNSANHHASANRSPSGPGPADDLFSALPFPACILSDKCVVLQANSRLSDLLGDDAGALLNQTLSSLTLPDDLLQRNESDFSINTPTGRKLPVHTTITSFKRGVETHYLVIFQPGTAAANEDHLLRFGQTEEGRLTSVESKYKLLFEASPLPVYVMERATFRYLAVNKAMQTLYGYTEQEFLKMTSVDLRPEKEIERFVSYVRNLSSQGSQGVWKHKTKKGKLIYVEVITHEIIYENKDALLVILNDVSDKVKVERKIRRINKELRELSKHLQDVREEERKQIARDIHDELGQQLTALKMDLAWVSKHAAENNAIIDKTGEMIQLVNETMTSMRRITSDLRPSLLDHLGLVPALEWLNEDVEKRYGVAVEFAAEEMPEMPLEVSTNLFRIYQEALTNVIRHAEAAHIKSVLKAGENSLMLEICDDGKGIARNQRLKGKGFGLLGIKERVFASSGLYVLSSEPGKGTCLRVEIPLKTEELL